VLAWSQSYEMRIAFIFFRKAKSFTYLSPNRKKDRIGQALSFVNKANFIIKEPSLAPSWGIRTRALARAGR